MLRIKNKLYLLFLAVSIGGVFSACFSENDALLIDEVAIEPVINPVTQFITTGDKIYGYMVDDTTIIGFGGGYAYFTENLFDSLFYVADNISVADDIVYNDFENIVIYPTNVATTGDLRFDESNDFGGSYITKFTKSQNESTVIEGINVTGTHDYSAVSFVNKDLAWVFSNYTANEGGSVFDSGIKVYLMLRDFINNEIQFNLLTELSSNLQLLDAVFSDIDNGFMLVDDGDNLLMLLSTDGGLGWNIPVGIDASASGLNKIEIFSDNQWFVYSTNTPSIYSTSNAGETWQSTTLNNGTGTIVDVFVVDETHAFVALKLDEDEIASIGHVFKTSNSGNSWEQANEQLLYVDELDFISPERGIAVSQNVMQLTTNGGETWELLVHPLD